MLLRNSWLLGWLPVVVVAGIGIQPGQGIQVQAVAQIAANTPTAGIQTLANGDYQFCSEPAPTDWRDGSGVCFVFQKTDMRVDGYYGYPHSDVFICFRGTVEDAALNGEALVLLWEGETLEDIPADEFTWDAEGHLRLNHPEQRSPNELIFHNAQLNLQGFYQYAQPRMKNPSELCSWSAL